jgi:hypothetical protein
MSTHDKIVYFKIESEEGNQSSVLSLECTFEKREY